MADFSGTDNLLQKSDVNNSLTLGLLLFPPILPVSFVDNIYPIINEHNYGIHNEQEAIDFNIELYNHLHCDYNSTTENKYFNETTKEEIEQQKEDLKKLKELYKKEDSTIEYRNKLNKYLEKYVYSKRKWEDFRESEVKHDIGHNLRLEYLVENILNEVDEIDEQFKKDAITFAVMHDITHRGSPDFTDHESSIQFITFIKEMGSTINYSQNILADKDKENIQVENEDEKEIKENEEKNIKTKEQDKQYSNLISALVSLGDCVDYRRYGEIDQKILNKRKERVIDILKLVSGCVIDEELINNLIEENNQISVKMEKDFHMYYINNASQISQFDIRHNFELLTNDIPNSKTQKEFLQNYIFYEYYSKPLTNQQTTDSFDALEDVRNENIYFLLKGCGLVDKNIDVESIKEIYDDLNTRYEKEDKIKYVFCKITINEKEYIIRETIYEDRFVDENNEMNYKEFKIFKNKDLDEIKTKDDINNLEELDEQDIQNIINPISTNLIEKEKQFQLNRLNRLYPFIDNLFNEDLAKKIKEELQNSIDILFDDDINIEKKFESKEKLASLLKLIKTSYKKDKEFTDHYLMLTGICNAKTPEELKKELQYLYHVAIPRTYYKERVKENPFGKVEPITGKSFKGRNIFRGIRVNPSILNQNMFKNLDPINIHTFDSYWSIPNNTDKFYERKIGQANDRGNITSFSLSAARGVQGMGASKKNGICFVCKPNKERGDISGSVDKAVKSNIWVEEEYNTFKMETSEIAFGLKISNGVIFDVVFNDNFNGEFYIKKQDGSKEIISKEKLRTSITNINLVDNNIRYNFINFLENELVIERFIEKDAQDIEKKYIDDVLQKSILDNIDNKENLDKLNKLMNIYYLSKDMNILSKIENGIINNNIEFYEFIYNYYYNSFPKNIDGLLDNYNYFQESHKNIIDKLIYYNLTIPPILFNKLDKYYKKLADLKSQNGEKIIDKQLIYNYLWRCDNINDFISKIDKNVLKEIWETDCNNITKYYYNDIVYTKIFELYDDNIPDIVVNHILNSYNVCIKNMFGSINLLLKTKNGTKWFLNNIHTITSRFNYNKTTVDFINDLLSHSKDYLNVDIINNICKDFSDTEYYDLCMSICNRGIYNCLDVKGIDTIYSSYFATQPLDVLWILFNNIKNSQYYQDWLTVDKIEEIYNKCNTEYDVIGFLHYIKDCKNIQKWITSQNIDIIYKKMSNMSLVNNVSAFLYYIQNCNNAQEWLTVDKIEEMYQKCSMSTDISNFLSYTKYYKNIQEWLNFDKIDNIINKLSYEHISNFIDILKTCKYGIQWLNDKSNIEKIYKKCFDIRDQNEFVKFISSISQNNDFIQEWLADNIDKTCDYYFYGIDSIKASKNDYYEDNKNFINCIVICANKKNFFNTDKMNKIFESYCKYFGQSLTDINYFMNSVQGYNNGSAYDCMRDWIYNINVDDIINNYKATSDLFDIECFINCIKQYKKWSNEETSKKIYDLYLDSILLKSSKDKNYLDSNHLEIMLNVFLPNSKNFDSVIILINVITKCKGNSDWLTKDMIEQINNFYSFDNININIKYVENYFISPLSEYKGMKEWLDEDKITNIFDKYLPVSGDSNNVIKLIESITKCKENSDWLTKDMVEQMNKIYLCDSTNIGYIENYFISPLSEYKGMKEWLIDKKNQDIREIYTDKYVNLSDCLDDFSEKSIDCESDISLPQNGNI